MNNILKNFLDDKIKTGDKTKTKNRELQRYKNYFETIKHEKTKLSLLKTKTIVKNERFIGFINEKKHFNNKNEETIDIYDINDVKRRNVKIICNVYQEKYDNINVTGFGDFIRGSYFLLNFCETHNFEFKFLINHPIKKYLLNSTNNLDVNVLRNIKFFIRNNCSQHSTDKNNYIHTTPGNNINSSFVSFLSNDVQVFDNSVFIYNIIYPYKTVEEKHKEIMRNLLEPINDIKYEIDKKLEGFNLRKKEFILIHIRSGDTYLKNPTNKINNAEYIKKITREIFYLIKHYSPIFSNNKYLLISDNIELKSKMKDIFPTINTDLSEGVHFGEGVIQEDDKVKNTLLEFYLMSCSSCIYSYSCYNHGSGFSQWCAETYNIPYYCKLIK